MPLVLAGRSGEDFMRRSAHNSYLSFLAEGGLVVSVPLAALITLLMIRGALAAIKLNRRGERWALGVYASFIAMSVHFWSLAGLTGTHAWFDYGLVAATIVLAERVCKLEAPEAGKHKVVRPKPTLVRGSLIASRQ
jgi:O-antigen ligase